MMSMVFRILSGAVGVAFLAGTVVLALRLPALGHDPRVYLAGYMAIGGILLGAYLLFFAIKGQWFPNDGKNR